MFFLYIKRLFSLYLSCSYEQESKTQFVVDAVYAFAYALHQLHDDLCVKNHQKQEALLSQIINSRQRQGTKGVCREMINYDGFEFYKNYLLKVSFIGKYHPKIFNACIVHSGSNRQQIFLIPFIFQLNEIQMKTLFNILAKNYPLLALVLI